MGKRTHTAGARWLLVALMAAVMLLGTAATAYAVSGRVTNSKGDGLEGINVYAWDGWSADSLTGVTDSLGDYSIGALSGTTYQIYFSADLFNAANGTSFVNEYYPDWVDGAATGIDATLLQGGAISGRVTGGGGPLEGIDVYVMDTSWNWLGSAVTDEFGTYVVTGVAPGDCYVRFDPSFYNSNNSSMFVDEYYNDIHLSWMANPTPVTVAEDVNTSDIDADLEIGGTISGTVTGDGGPLENVDVSVYDQDGNNVGWGYTAADGTYTTDVVLPGDYTVRFSGTGMFLGEWYENARDSYSATPVTVTAGNDTPGINAALDLGGSISGTVIGDGGAPLEGIRVEAFDWANDTWESAYTAADGTYSIQGLPDGDYRVRFDPWMYNDDNGTSFLGEYYDNVRTSDDATLVGVELATDTPDIDADLEIGGSISGTVTGSGGPLKGVYVSAYGGNDSFSAMTDADGTYTIPAVPDGDYRVWFDASERNEDYDTSFLGEYYDNVRTWESATPVHVALKTNTPNINATLEVGGTIRGTVTGDGGPLAGIWVDAYDSAADVWMSAYTDTDGSYALRGLSAGDYTVSFGAYEYNDVNGTSFLDEYYDNARDEADATPVGVSLGQTRTGIDADLEIGGTISGAVTGDGGAPLEDVVVIALDAEGQWADSTETGVDGLWTVTALQPGDYTIMFSPVSHNQTNGTQYVREYWDDRDSYADADAVAVDYEDELTGYDAQLAQGGGSITGTVYEPDGTTPLADIGVYVEEILPSGQAVEVGWAVSGADGTYEVGGLGTGQYAVLFADDMETYKRMFYDGAPSIDSDEGQWALLADPVSVTLGVETSGIDAVMQLPASLTGMVVDAAGEGIPNIAVNLWYEDDVEGWVLVHQHETETDGMFEFSGGWCGLLTGSYKLEFVDLYEGVLDTVWYLDATTADDATVIDVLAGQDYELDPQSMPISTPPTGLTVTKVEGTNRIGTSIAASKLAFPAGADTVVIATAFNWPDALGGAALAGAVDGPILLTNTASLPAEVTAEITRLGATKAIILGGTAAVGNAVENALNAKLGAANVDRLAGSGRYETARLIAARCVDELEAGPGYNGTAFVATGANFPDALGASPLAAANGWPIYLVNPATGADATLVNAMKADGVDDVLVLGGTSVVTDKVKNDLAAKLPASTQRLAGPNRYDTARTVATFGVNEAGLAWNKLAIATGANFPDALAGGVLQGKSGSVMLLTPSGSLNAGVAGVLTANKASIHEVRFLGGTGAVTTAVRTAVSKALQ